MKKEGDMKSLARKAFFTLLVVCLPASAFAGLLGPSPYLCFDATVSAGCGTADSPFADEAFGYFYLEDFEDNLLNVPGVASSAGNPTGPYGLTDSVDADDGIIDGSGTNGHSFYGGGAAGFTFTFDANVLGSLPTHVGVVWTDGAITNEVTFEAFDSNGGSLGVIIAPGIGDSNFYGGTDEDRFFGVTDPVGISAIHIFNSVMSGGGSGIEIDHLQYGGGVVPVPAAVWLFGSGLIGLIGVAGRKQS